MASHLHVYAPAPYTIGASHRQFAGVIASAVSITNAGRYSFEAKDVLNLRSEKKASAQARQRLSPVFASNTNPSAGSDDTKTSDTAQGPPFLTILAGLVVFAGICWIIGSIVMWIVGLIVHPPPLK